MSLPDQTDNSESGDVIAVSAVALERVLEAARRITEDAVERQKRASDTIARAERLRQSAMALRAKCIQVP